MGTHIPIPFRVTIIVIIFSLKSLGILIYYIVLQALIKPKTSQPADDAKLISLPSTSTVSDRDNHNSIYSYYQRLKKVCRLVVVVWLKEAYVTVSGVKDLTLSCFCAEIDTLFAVFV
jgi:hypothetical protein